MTPTTREIAKTTDLPRHEASPIWVDHRVSNEAATEAFSAWLDAELEHLEARYRPYWTRRSLKNSLAR